MRRKHRSHARERATACSPGTLDDELRALLTVGRLDDLHDAITRAELTGELPELYALVWRAALAVAERSDLARDYLEMADALASSPHERAVVAEHQAIYDLVSGDPHAAAERCLAALDRDGHTEGLWLNLLVALVGLGELDAIDAVLHGLGRLSRDCAVRLVARMCAEPALDGVRARAAFRPLFERGAAL